MKSDSPFGVLLIKEGEEAGLATTHAVGTLAKITDFYQGSDGLLGITAVGQQRFRLLSSERQADGLIIGQVELIPAEDPMPLPKQSAALAHMLSNVLEDLGRLYESIEWQLDDAVWITYRFLEILPIGLEKKQISLESGDTTARLKLVDELLELVRGPANH
jgi:Lon protease-like protein